MDLVVFWIVAPVSVIAGLLMLVQRNAVYAALFLVLVQFTLAVFFVLLDAQFLAAVQVIVYAGAIMVLFLFVIMLLGVDRREALVEPIRFQRWAAAGLGAALIAGVAVAVSAGGGLFEAPTAEPPPGGNTQAVSRVLFTDFVFPFEVTSVLLIVAAVAAIVLTGRRRRPREPSPPPEPAEAPPAEGS